MRYMIAAAIWAVQAAPALACSAVLCREPELRLPSSGTVPANELYAEVLVDDPGSLTLRDLVTGAVIPASIRALGSAKVFAPDVPLTSGQEVELSTDSECEPLKVRRYTITAPATRDGSAPLLQAVAQGIRATEGEPSQKYSFVELTYASPGLPGSQTDVRIDVDGALYSNLLGADAAQRFTLLAYCDGSFSSNSCGTMGSWTTGKHVVNVTSYVVGQAPRVQSLEIDLDCGDGGRVTDGELVANPELKSEGVEDDGCQLGGVNGGGLLAGLLALGLRRRSRSR